MLYAVIIDKSFCRTEQAKHLDTEGVSTDDDLSNGDTDFERSTRDR